METKVKEDNAVKVKDFICYHWEMVHNYDSHHLGRIWICWDPNLLTMDVLFSSDQVITCKVIEAKELRLWFLSVVYGANQVLDRRVCWGIYGLIVVLLGTFLGWWQVTLMSFGFHMSPVLLMRSLAMKWTL